jgi:hypothetical protein
MVVLAGVLTHAASAVATVPTKMNFQGRLTDSTGNVMADGLYNMKFRLYTVASGGSAVWTETRETTNRVQLTNGLFSVQLGSVTVLPDTLFASGALYLEIELPTPATATCSTASCGSFTEGAMSPRNQMATSAYAFNSETLDGLDSSAFGQLSANNTFTGTNLFKPSNTATALQVQNASGINMLAVSTLGTDNAVTVTSGSTTGTTGPRALQLDSVSGSTGVVMGLSVAGTERGMLRADSSGNVVINATGTGKTWLNSDTGTGGVNVGSGSNHNNLTVNGTAATCTLGAGTGATNCTSDERLKKNIQGYDNAMSLDNILHLKPVNFEWKDQTEGNKGIKLGLIAQDVQGVLPEFVAQVGDTGYLGVDYAALVTPLIGAVQAQQAEIQKLQQAINVDGNLVVDNHVIGNPDTRGRLKIPAGQVSATYHFVHPYGSRPFVVASPEEQFAGYYVSSNEDSLTITLDQIASKDQWFVYMVQE